MSPPSQYNVAEPWARQPFDDDQSWPLFVDFRSTEPSRRSIQALAGRARVNWTWLETTAWENAWATRASLWDDHLDKLRTTTMVEAVQEDARARAKRHLRYTGKAGSFLERELDRYLQAYEQGEMPILSPRDLIRWLALTVRTERMVAGDATEIIAAQTTDLSGLSLEELRALRDLQQKAARAA